MGNRELFKPNLEHVPGSHCSPLKFEANRFRGSCAMIGQTNRHTEITTLYIYVRCLLLIHSLSYTLINVLLSYIMQRDMFVRLSRVSKKKNFKIENLYQKKKQVHINILRLTLQTFHTLDKIIYFFGTPCKEKWVANIYPSLYPSLYLSHVSTQQKSRPEIVLTKAFKCVTEIILKYFTFPPPQHPPPLTIQTYA